MLNEIAPRTRPNRDDAGHVPGGSDIQAPFADEVLRLRRTRPLSEPIVSFHALPWGQGRSLAAPARSARSTGNCSVRHSSTPR